MKMVRKFNVMRNAVSWAAFTDIYFDLLCVVLVVLAAITAFYLRIQTYVAVVESGIAVNSPEAKLNELDPFINTWLVKYLDEHGPLAVLNLKPPNDDALRFWYPKGRDFVSTMLWGPIYTMYIVYELLKPFGVSLYDVMAVAPAVAGALTVIGIALLVNELVKSRTASVIASWIYAVSYISREVAGFNVNYTYGLTIAPYALWFQVKAFKSRSLRDFIIAGLLIAYAAQLWAGVSLTYAPLLFFIVTLALIPKLLDLNTVRNAIVGAAIPLITMLFTPYYGGMRSVQALVLAVAIGILVIGFTLKMFFGSKYRNYLLMALILGGIIGGVAVLYFNVLGLGGKVALALGIRTGGLPETIAQYRSLWSDAVRGLLPFRESLEIFSFIVYLFAVLMLVLLRGREELIDKIAMLGIVLWAFLSFYSAMNTAYFADYMTIAYAVIAGLLAGMLMPYVKPSRVRYALGVRFKFGFWNLIVMLILLMLLSPTLYVIALDPNSGYKYYITPPASLTMLARAEQFPRPTTAWIDVLNFLRYNTSSKALVISWWDYGHWLTSVAGKITAADGATLYGDQIKLIADLFTGNSTDENVYKPILRKLGVCDKQRIDEVYVVIYSSANIWLDPNASQILIAFPIYGGSAFGDIPKFISAITYISLDKRVYDFRQTPPFMYDILAQNVLGQGISVQGNEWVLTGSGSIVFYSLNWASQSVRTATLPRALAWASTLKLKQLYPSATIRIVPDIIGYDAQTYAPLLVCTPALCVFDYKQSNHTYVVEDPEAELSIPWMTPVYISFDSVSMGERLPLYLGVFVAVFKVNLDVICS